VSRFSFVSGILTPLLPRRAGIAVASLIVIALVVIAAAQTPGPARPSPQPFSSVRVLFGLTDTEPASWDGTITLDSGSVKAIQGWRFGPEDSTDYARSWKAATRAQGNGPDSILENGVLITADAPPGARWSLHTPKGDFSFTLHDLPWGDQKTFLDGAVAVDRVPPTAQLTTSDDDEDYPALARANDDIWMSFVRFSHPDRTLETAQKIEDLARPAGGDQVFAMHYARGTWEPPIPVSPRGEDVARTATAIDGAGRVWVVWSAQRNGNFDIYARAGRNGIFGPEIRVTSNAGPDLNPVAATDSGGRVWIAWQGFRESLDILAAVQTGDTFSPETTVSFSPASDWDPSIAASSNGDVAIAWDTYDKGDYDVWYRRLRFWQDTGKPEMDAPVPVATTPNFEARASAAFDARNRLWIAYEISTPRWGKNFGLYETTGTPLYENRDIRVKCFDGDAVFTTSGDLINVMPGAPGALRRARGTRSNRNILQPNPGAAANRHPNQNVNLRGAALNSAPRLAVDSAGGVYLAFRSIDGPLGSRSPVGSVWFEHVVYFDGHNWVGPVFLPRTDGLLDSRPALVALEPAHLLAVSAMDHRQSIPQGLGPAALSRVNSDLYSADLRLDGLPPPAQKPELMAMQRERPAPADPKTTAEQEQVALVRTYRIEAGEQRLRILRGDLDRHTEYSVDGTRDGSLADAYRYMIDAASLDWGGCCDTDYPGGGHEYFWWTEQKTTDEYRLGNQFISMFAYEHQAGVKYPDGRRVVLFAKRGIRPAPAADTPFLYRYLHMYGGISVPHATTTDQGTDWHDHDSQVEPVVEIYQGQRQSYEREDTPRAAKQGDAIGNWKAAATVTAALDKGYRLGFVAGSAHNSTHIAFTNVLAAQPTREAILEAIRQRHVYASTDNIVADVRCGDHLPGDEFSTTGQPEISVKLIGSAPFAKVTIVKDGKDVFYIDPKSKEVNLQWREKAPAEGPGASYYYVRGEQTDGQLVWTSPMWITVRP
jgi:hypothetical protein